MTTTEEHFNPYAAPKATIAPVTEAAISYDGKILKVPKNFVFPPVCLKTGTAEDLAPVRRHSFTWNSPLLFVLFVFCFAYPWLFLFLLIAMLGAKRARVEFHLSKAVARKRRNAILRNWAIFAVGFGALAVSVKMRVPNAGITGFSLIAVSLVLAVFSSRFLWATRIDKTHIWLGGVSKQVASALVVTQGQPPATVTA